LKFQGIKSPPPLVGVLFLCLPRAIPRQVG